VTRIPSETEAVELDRNYQVRVGLVTGRDELELVVNAPAQLSVGSNVGPYVPGRSVDAGSFILELDPGSILRFEQFESVPAECIYHVIVETILGNDEAVAAEAVRKWHGRGYDVEILCRGSILRATDGTEIDGRSMLVSAERFHTEREARDADRTIEQLGMNCWVAREIVEHSSGNVRLAVIADGDSSSAEEYVFEAPIQLDSSDPVTVRAVDFGFWSSRVQDAEFGGTLEIGLDPMGSLQLVNCVELEQYLRGVVPAEMPSSWPASALEAQAVCARSETLSRLGVRHMGDDFDLCATEHCQAYRGASWCRPSTDSAVERTTGVVLVTGDRLLEAVYSHNCGGHTEDNDVVWAAPPEMGLRGVPDAGPRALDGMSLKNEADLRDWLSGGTQAFCSHLKPDERKNFRWQVHRSAREIDELVARTYPEVGRIRDIRTTDRGVSGRLKSVKIVGQGATVTVQKELPIRRLFGGLYSAKFVLDIERGVDGMPTGFTFTGGGRGHGVGMCQDGARYLASSGWDYDDILRHYYGHATIVNLYE